MVNYKCCNPFKIVNHCNMKLKTRNVSANIAEKAKKVLGVDITNKQVCAKCNIKVFRLHEKEVTSSSDNTPAQSERVSPPMQASNVMYQHDFSEACLRLGGSPVRIRKLSETGYQQQQLNKIVELTCKNVLQVPVPNVPVLIDRDQPDHDEDEESFLKNIKEAFHREENYQNKMYLLSLIPEHWSSARIINEFAATRYMVEKAKKLVTEKGHGNFPDGRKKRMGLSFETTTLVESFYKSMNISRQLPGLNDYVSVRNSNGERIKKQKLLVLCSLAEAYQNFLEKYPLENIGFSKFAELRPKECILAGRAGTHNVCVCLIHQNNNLICPIISNFLPADAVIKNETELLKIVSCQNLTWDCCEGNCEECNKLLESFLQTLKASVETADVDELTYSNWILKDNIYTLEKVTSSIEEFLEMLSNSSKFGLSGLRKHDFIARQQSQYLQLVKDNLQIGEYAVIMDFSENYKFLIQNEIQAAHYYTHQATLFPIVAYFRSLEDEISILSYAVISDEETHDTAAVYCFQTKFIKFLKETSILEGQAELKYPVPQKIYYFTDGAVSQFKNKKNLANINHHKEDFNIDCEWNFFATSHGKGPSDGIGGTIKRAARAASLRSIDQSLFNTPKGFYEWCKDKSNIKSIHFDYVSKTEYASIKRKLNKRFSTISTVKNTRQIHQAIPHINKNYIQTKKFSNCSNVELSIVQN